MFGNCQGSASEMPVSYSRAIAKSARSGLSGARSQPGRSLIPPASFERHGSTLPEVTGLSGFVTTKNRLPGKSREKFTFPEHSEVLFVQDTPNAVEDEKPQTSVVDARSLRNISEIVKAIKERIDFGGRGDDGQRSVNCDPRRLA